MKGFEKDFQLKKDIDAITKLDPHVRHPRLISFLNKVTENQDSIKDLKQWNINFNPDLVSVTGNWLPEVKVIFAEVM